MKFIREKKLAKKILFVDGLSGAGKSLVGPLITSMQKSEYWVYDHLFEEILVLLVNNKIDLNSAKSLLRIHADMNIYNLAIGRNVNFRPNDHSGVFYGMMQKEFSKRLKIKDGDYIIKKILRKKLWLPIMSHNILIYSNYLNKLFSDREIFFISISRNPAKLICDYYDVNWESKINNNVRELFLTYKKKSGIYPWFLSSSHNNKSFIESYSEFVLNYHSYQKKLKLNHYLINFENFIQKPEKDLENLKKILGSQTITTKKILRSFNLPRDKENYSIKDCLSKIDKIIRNKKLNKAIHLACERYS
jgi:hypothetical protein